MRRFFLGLAIASLTASAPVTAYGGDREIADEIITTIKEYQASGLLKGFDIDLSVENGVVTLMGSVVDNDQASAILNVAHNVLGVEKVLSNITVREARRNPQAEPAAAGAPALRTSRPSGVQQASGTNGDDEFPLLIGGKDVTSQVPASLPLGEPPRMEVESSTGSPNDALITNAALQKLSQAKASGQLKHFELDLSTVDGEVWVRGHVANAAQKNFVLQTVQRVPGVRQVVDDLTVQGAPDRSQVRPASDSHAAEPMAGSMPVMGAAPQAPRPFAPSSLAAYDGGVMTEGAITTGEPMMPTPVPMNMGPSYGAGVPRYDQPQMPGYAWPSYAAYPNYSAVTYPKQYSASAWPYIGPFYPYPQVPLGWRKVALEWDDGLWYLDFTSK